MLPKTYPNFIVIIRVTTFECFKTQMVINLAPVSLSNKKVNFYTCPRLTFLKKNATENDYKSIFENFLGERGGGGREACLQRPLAARALGARNLPRLVLKSGYGPVRQVIFSLRASSLRMFIAAKAVVKSYPN